MKAQIVFPVLSTMVWQRVRRFDADFASCVR
jgi:hypothetical protein